VLSRPELIYPDSSTLLDLERSYAACPLQRKLGVARYVHSEISASPFVPIPKFSATLKSNDELPTAVGSGLEVHRPNTTSRKRAQLFQLDKPIRGVPVPWQRSGQFRPPEKHIFVQVDAK
jgi:hypothetical protein